MTGNYPDAPAPRMAYDKDGTQGYMLSGTTAVAAQLTLAQMQTLNNEDPATNFLPGGNGFNGAVCLIFPELRDLGGVFNALNSQAAPTFQVSANTTNGIDGTWTNVAAVTQQGWSTTAARLQINAVSLSGIKSLRVVGTPFWQNPWGGHLHVYGKIAAGQNPDRLSFWHPTLDQPLSDFPAYFDWGDRPRATSATKQVRIKNRSAALTANNITVSMSALTDTSPTMVSVHDFSLDGGATYASSVVIPALAPGEISPVVTVRQTLSASTTLSLWSQWINAVAGSWT